jgi:hypothetical protein
MMVVILALLILLVFILLVFILPVLLLVLLQAHKHSLPKVMSERLILAPSCNVLPVAPVFDARSDPAKSTRFILATKSCSRDTPPPMSLVDFICTCFCVLGIYIVVFGILGIIVNRSKSSSKSSGL